MGDFFKEKAENGYGLMTLDGTKSEIGFPF